MTIEFSDACEAKISELISEGVFSSKEEFVEAAIDYYIAYDEAELTEIRSAVTEGLEQAKRGQSTALEDVIAELKAERALSR